MQFLKRADKTLSDIQKGLVFTTSAVLKKADELKLAQNENRPPKSQENYGLRRLCYKNYVGFVTLMGRAHKQISGERKERLKPALNEDIRTLKLCNDVVSVIV